MSHEGIHSPIRVALSGVQAVCDEHARDLGPTLEPGAMQRRVSVLLPDACVRPCLEEEADGCLLPGQHRVHERRLAAGPNLVQVVPGLDRLPQVLGGVLHHGVMDGDRGHSDQGQQEATHEEQQAGSPRQRPHDEAVAIELERADHPNC